MLAVLVALPAMRYDASLLQKRMAELQHSEALPVVMLPETMLPRQRLRLTQHQWLEGVLSEGNHTRIGVLSRASPLHGVEATLDDDGASLVAKRVIACTEDGMEASLGNCVETRVRFADLKLADALNAASSPSRAVELTARELGPLVERWLGLLAERQTPDGTNAADDVLAALGPLPGIDTPSERALYVAALLNPYGCRFDATEGDVDSLWPAIEIRSTMLTAPTAMHRLTIAKTGLVDSIYKLKGGQWPMNTYYW